jgi:hypothetical protein
MVHVRAISMSVSGTRRDVRSPMQDDLATSFHLVQVSTDKLRHRWRYRAMGKRIGEYVDAIAAAVRTGALDLEAQLAVIDLEALLGRMRTSQSMLMLHVAHDAVRAFAERWDIQISDDDVVALDPEGYRDVMEATAAQQAWQATGDPRAWHDCKICEAVERQKARRAGLPDRPSGPDHPQA